MIKLSNTLFLDRDIIKGFEIVDTPSNYCFSLRVHCTDTVLEVTRGKLETLIEQLNKIVKEIEDYDRQ